MIEEDGKFYYEPDEWKALPVEQRHEIEKKQLFGHLQEAGTEAAEYLLEQIEAGKMYGRSYWDEGDECGCVLGTLKFKTSDFDVDEAEMTDTEDWKSSQYMTNCEGYETPNLTVVEVLAYNLEKGDTPDNNENARLLRDWTKEWLDKQRVAS